MYNPNLDITEGKCRLDLQSSFLIKKDISNLRTILRDEATVLDVGCSNGNHTRKVYNDFNVQVTGIDSNSEAISKTKNDSKHTFKVFDIVTDDLSKLNKYDVVTCYLVLHHIDSVEVLKRVISLVKQGGWLVIRTSSDSDEYKKNEPTNDDLDFLLGITGKIAGASNRLHVELLEKQLDELGQKYLFLPYLTNTLGMDSSTRVDFFNDNYGFRDQVISSLSKNEPTPYNLELFNKIQDAINRQRKNFMKNKVFSETNQPTFLIQC